MREVISVHLGETGIGTGLALWDYLELEQGREDTFRDTGVFFHEAEDGRQVARAVFGDLDPQSLGVRRMGEDRWTPRSDSFHLFIPSFLLIVIFIQVVAREPVQREGGQRQ